MAYVELHARSGFNFLRGAVTPRQLVAGLHAAEIPAAASLDRNGVYGAPSFTFACQEAGIEAIIGAELTLAARPGNGAAPPPLGHLPVLVENRTGYRNLCRLLTQMHLRWRKNDLPGGVRPEMHFPSLRLEEIAPLAEGLIALTGDDEGPLVQGWREAGHTGMEQALAQLLRVFPAERLYVEIQRQLARGEDACNRALLELAERHGLRVVATNSPAFVEARGRCVLDVFTCLRHHTTLDQAGRLLERNAERVVKGEAAMRALFADLPGAIDETARLAERLPFRLKDLGYAFPKFPVPQGESLDSFLRKVTFFGAEQRYGSLTRKIRQQLEHELAIIGKLGFAGYFLIVWDIVNLCREHGIMAQGRGSAANSAVCYSLGITAVDPIGGRLLFERFLSEGRQSWPDIDIDLPSGDLREKIIQGVYQKYGQHGAAMTANVITYRGRSAMREIGKVSGLPPDVIERFNALLARGDYPHTLEMTDQLRQAGLDARNPRHRAALEVYEQMVGLPRHLGQHSGGMIICNDELHQAVPLENASMPGRVVAQWDKDACEDLGIIKIDLLGLGMMAVLQDCVELTHQRGRGVDIAHLPKDDTATYDLLCRAETMGVFQVESRAQMATLPRMKPRKFYDLAVEIAIIRPGPIAGELANPYLNRRNGLEPVDYIDERLKPVLERTLGVPLFQEQVLQIAIIMASYQAGESEELRRVLGFTRDQDRIEKAKANLRRKLQQQRVDPEKIERIVDTINRFALYGFPESHAISFALLAYASAWLKVHRPEEFFCALLNNQPMGFYSSATLIQDGRRYGLRFRPPDVMASAWACTIEEPAAAGEKAAIRLGLQQVKGVNEGATTAMLAARAERPFASLRDFRLRTPFDRDELRALAKAGALNSLAGSRRRALWQIEQPLEPDLFSLAEEEGPGEADTPLAEMTLWERICADFETTAVTTGAHPMRLMRPRLPENFWQAAELPQARNDQRVVVAGAVICRQRPGTAKGVVFISLEDETGVSNCVLYPDLFEKVRLTATQEPYLVITGKVQHCQGSIHIITSQVEALRYENAPEAASHDFH